MSRWPDDEDEHALSGEEVELSGRRVLPFDFDNSDCEYSGLDDELQSFLPADLGQSADPYFGGKGFAMTFGSQGVGGERAPALCAQENVPFDVLGGSRTSHSLLATSSPFHVMEEDDDTNEAWSRFNFTERADYVGEVGEGGRMSPPPKLLQSDQGLNNEHQSPGLTALNTTITASMDARASAKTPLAGPTAGNLKFTPINKFAPSGATLGTITKVPAKVQAKRSLITAMPASIGEMVKTKKQKINRGRSNTGQFLPKKYTWCYVTSSGRRKKNKNGNYVEWNGKAGKKREKTRPKGKGTKRAHSAKKPKV